MMAYTCSVCETKQARTFAKDAYTKGVVLMRCEGCDKLHLIADNLGWFRDESVNIEQIMAEKGESVNTNIRDSTIEFTVKPTEEAEVPETP
jgi:mitochondrial protein import protein ZIM17